MRNLKYRVNYKKKRDARVFAPLSPLVLIMRSTGIFREREQQQQRRPPSSFRLEYLG